jgi:hypothetical protein
MNKQLALLIVILMCCLSVAGILSGEERVLAQEQRSYVYEQVDVILELQENGSLQVVETTTFAFRGGQEKPFTFAFRDIKMQRLDNISDIQVSVAGTPYEEVNEGEKPGTYIIQPQDDTIRVKWFFPPIEEGTLTIDVAYMVDGVVRVDENEHEVWWVAVSPDRDVPVNRSSVTLTMPQAIDEDVLEVTLPAEQGDVSQNGHVFVVTRDNPLAPGDHLDVSVLFPAGYLDVDTPRWQKNENTGGPPVCLLLPFLGAFIVLFYVMFSGKYDITVGGPTRSGGGGRGGGGGGGGGSGGGGGGAG